MLLRCIESALPEVVVPGVLLGLSIGDLALDQIVSDEIPAVLEHQTPILGGLPADDAPVIEQRLAYDLVVAVLVRQKDEGHEGASLVIGTDGLEVLVERYGLRVVLEIAEAEHRSQPAVYRETIERRVLPVRRKHLPSGGLHPRDRTDYIAEPVRRHLGEIGLVHRKGDHDLPLRTLLHEGAVGVIGNPSGRSEDLLDLLESLGIYDDPHHGFGLGRQ